MLKVKKNGTLTTKCICESCKNRIDLDLMPKGTLNSYSDGSPVMLVGIGEKGMKDWKSVIIQGEELLDLGKRILMMYPEESSRG
jgi:hypothetical protein